MSTVCVCADTLRTAEWRGDDVRGMKGEKRGKGDERMKKHLKERKREKDDEKIKMDIIIYCGANNAVVGYNKDTNVIHRFL